MPWRRKALAKHSSQVMRPLMIHPVAGAGCCINRIQFQWVIQKKSQMIRDSPGNFRSQLISSLGDRGALYWGD
jgi:hypothetical protein